MGKLSQWVKECIEGCRTRGELNASNNGQVLIEKFANYIDDQGGISSDTNTIVLQIDSDEIPQDQIQKLELISTKIKNKQGCPVFINMCQVDGERAFASLTYAHKDELWFAVSSSAYITISKKGGTWELDFVST